VFEIIEGWYNPIVATPPTFIFRRIDANWLKPSTQHSAANWIRSRLWRAAVIPSG
jgi:hypothetical protein